MGKFKEWLLIPSFLLIFIIAGTIAYADIFPTMLAPDIKIEKEDLDLSDPLVIKFDRPVIRHKIESSFKVEPGVVGKIEWKGNDLLFWPIQPWKPGEKFKINFSGVTRAAFNFYFESTFKSKALPEVLSLSPQDNAKISPESPIDLKLKKESGDYHLDFKITPFFENELSIDNDRKEFKIIPNKPLDQGTRYQIIAYASYYDSKSNKNWYSTEIANFQFETIASPQVAKVVPASGEKDIKEFTPFKVYFDKPMKTEEWEKFVEITPKVTGNVIWEEEEKVMVFKPEKWASNVNYSVKIKEGWKAKDNTYLNREILSNFKSFDSSDLAGKKNASTYEPKITEGKYIDINLSRQILTIFRDGINMGNYKISSGKRGMATPTGMYDVLNKKKRAWSRKYKLFMPYWMQFTRAGHGIHELPEWPSGYKEGANHLGIAVSHGCVRLGVGAAETVYGFADVGTPVYIHY